MTALGRRAGYGMVLAAASLWGVTATVSRTVMDAGVDATSLAQLRITAAAVLLLGWVAVRHRTALRVGPREAARLAAFGVLGLMLVQWLYFVALARIPVGIALVIEYTAPLLVALWATTVGRERLPAGVWAAIVAALAGLALALGVGGDELGGVDAVGLLAAAGAAVAFAVYVLLAEREVRTRPPVAVLGLGMAVGAACWAVVHPWGRVPFDVLGGATPLGGPVEVAVPVVALVAFVVVLGTVAPFALMVAALPRIGATAVASTAMVEPVVAAGVAWVWLDQALGTLQLVGGALVLAAVAVAQILRDRGVRAEGPAHRRSRVSPALEPLPERR